MCVVYVSGMKFVIWDPGSWNLCMVFAKTILHIHCTISGWYLANLYTRWTSLNIFWRVLILLHKLQRLKSLLTTILVRGVWDWIIFVLMVQHQLKIVMSGAGPSTVKTTIGL